MTSAMTVGGVTLDILLPDGPQDRSGSIEKKDIPWIETAVGGGAANAATILSKLGRQVAIHCAIGGDKEGHLLLQELKGRKINTDAVEVYRNHSTGLALISVAHDGNVTVKAARGANLSFKGDGIDATTVALMYITSSPEHVYARVHRRRANDPDAIGFVAINPGMSQIVSNDIYTANLLKNADLLILNAAEARLHARKSRPGWDYENTMMCAKDIASKQSGVTCVTDGSNGAWLCDGDTLHFQPASSGARQTEIGSMIGAGDTFGATLAHFLAAGIDLKHAAGLASQNAAATIGDRDASSGAKPIADLL